MNLPPMLEYQQAEVAVFDNRIARPAAGRDQRSAADQAHRAMHDDRVCLVSLDHTDIEEAGIFAIHRVMHDGTIAVAMVLRRLHHTDLRIDEGRYQVFEPVGVHDIIRVDDSDDLGICSGMRKRKPQRSGFITADVVLVSEFETLAQHAAMILDRSPKRRIGRVVDDNNALEIWIVEPCHRIERDLEHLRRLAMGGNVDRHLRCEAFRRWQGGGDEPARAAPKDNDCNLFDARERDRDQRSKEYNTEHKRKSSSEHEIMSLPERENCREPGAHSIGDDRECGGLPECGGASRQDRQRYQQTQEHR